MESSVDPFFSGPELCSLEAHQIVQLLDKGEISANELLTASFDRQNQVEAKINAIPITCEERARNSISNLDQHKQKNYLNSGWLGGLPIAIKDLNDVKGVLTTCGNIALKDNVAEVSDPLVKLLETRGAIIIGKTNTPEFGAGGNTFNDVFGMTRNPWDTSKNAGGSSGGAAASVASGEVWLSHGSDLAGSLRTPAAYCGVVGLRPTPGRVSAGRSPTAFLMEAVSGPMARTVRDAALFLDSMTAYNPRNPLSLEAPVGTFQQAVIEANTNIRIAYSPDLNGFAPVEQEIDTILRDALVKTQGIGAKVEEDCPPLDHLCTTYKILRGIYYGAVNGRMPENIQKHFKETLRKNVEYGQKIQINDIYDAYRNRTVLYHSMCDFLEVHDVLACPVVGLEPGLVEEEYPLTVAGQPVDDYIDWLRFSFLSTTTSLPSISIPVGFTKSGMPVGMQLIGSSRGEAKLLAVAKIIEDTLGFTNLTPIDPIDKSKIR